jgi:hypothetical protein
VVHVHLIDVDLSDHCILSLRHAPGSVNVKPGVAMSG